MNPSRSSRRAFLLGAAAGLGMGTTAAWLALRHGRDFLNAIRGIGGFAPEIPIGFAARPPASGSQGDPMPGQFPGRVIEVRHPGAVSPKNEINSQVVNAMIDRGMAEFTGTEPGDVKAAWGMFFQKGDVVGIKVNPVGRAGANPPAVGSISSPAVLIKVVQCLKEIGIPPRDLIVFERYATEFLASYKSVMSEPAMQGVRWYASSAEYTNEQLDIAGFDPGHSLSSDYHRNVAGYDPDVFTTMGFAAREHSKRDDRRFRSHLSVIVTRMINKMITLPVLKDHRSAGVTLALKNMSHGMNNNVARSHISDIKHGFSEDSSFVTGPNQCNTFIPQAVSQQALRQRATLHLLDGLIGVYEGGPGNWNKTWGTWRHKGLFFATDPVAMDHVGWDIIDAKRVRMGWPPVAKMGFLQNSQALTAQTFLTTLAASNTIEAAALGVVATNIEGGRRSETLNMRQPDHIALAGELGLGLFDRDKIWYRLVEMQKSEVRGQKSEVRTQALTSDL
jgi:uncharacterized protein (DUF362 family)